MFCERIELKSGQIRWRCIADAPPHPVTGKRRQIERRAKTQREAKQRVLAAIEKLKQRGVDEKAIKKLTFEEVAQKWLAVYAATGVSKGSIRIREKEIKILNKYFAKVPISNITHAFYQDALISMSKDGKNGKPYAENTLRGVNTTANMIFKYAKKNKWIDENPREDAIIPKKPITVEDLEKNNIEETFFESHELDIFLDAVLKIGLDLDKEIFFTLAFTGMRVGELCALTKDDLDFDKNKIRISKSLYLETNNPKKYEITTTKTKKVRIIDMDEKLMLMLKNLIRKNDKQKMKNRMLIEDFHDSDFVFQNYDGYPLSTKKIRDRMRRIMKYVGIDKRLTPHSLRHTHVSMMTEAGNDLPSIMERIGHEDPNTTLKIYTHVTEKMKVESINKISTYKSEILEKLTI